MKSRWFLAFIAAGIIASLDRCGENAPLIRLALYGLLALIFVLLTIDLALWLWHRFAKTPNDKVPLMAAVRRAYSETKDSLYARHGRAIAGASKSETIPDELLLWYASGLSRNATIWGCEKPSECSKPQDVENCQFAVQDGEIVARKLYADPPMITRLMVSEKEVAAFIQRVAKYPSVRV